MGLVGAAWRIAGPAQDPAWASHQLLDRLLLPSCSEPGPCRPHSQPVAPQALMLCHDIFTANTFSGACWGQFTLRLNPAH